jgi:hypothetical protein
MSVETIVQEIDNEIANLTQARNVLASLNGSSSNGTLVIAKGRFFASSAKMAAAQKARWAKYRASKGQTQTAKPIRIISSAARKRMAAAQKARWAKFRTEPRKRRRLTRNQLPPATRWGFLLTADWT